MTDPLGNKVSILIVDDRPEKRLALGAVLEDLGENVVLADSGREALRQVLRRDFAVILLDISMPDIDGFETAALIRARRRSRQTPIIFLTAFTDDLHVSRCYELGAVDFMLTPVVPNILRTKVAVFVELSRKNEQVKLQADALRRRAAQLHRLTRASLQINGARALEATLQAIADAARFVLDVRLAATTTPLGQGAGRPRSFVSLAEDDAGGAPSVPSEMLSSALYELAMAAGGSVRMTEQEVEMHLSSRAAEDDEAPGSGPRKMAPRLRGILTAGLNGANGAPVGLIQLSDKVDGDFTDGDEALLAQLAQVASLALQNCLHAEEREANRLKDEFLANLSHELRTPLNAILGWTRILRTTSADPVKIARGLEIIERNVDAQTRLIEDLLDISRITAGKLSLAASPRALGPIVETAVEALRPAADARKVSLSTTLEEGEGLVNADADRLQQVVTNLLTNAIKFTPGGGRVETRLARTGAWFELSVRDNGEGLAPELLPFVFDRYRQADSSTKKSNAGLGLGLAIVRHLVELHGGSVRAESPGRNQGSTFVVRLPALADDARSGRRLSPPPETREPPDAEAALSGLRVLVVEDDPDAREMMKEVLIRHHAVVMTAGSTQEAVDTFDALPPDVLVSDVAMPGEDGYDLMRRVRRRAPQHGGDVPALALTSYARAEDRARALSAGFQMHAAKPIEPAALVAAVTALAMDRAARAAGRRA